MSDIGESVIFIGFVYSGVLIPWSLLYVHDYLSEKWVKVGRAIFHGLVHATIAFIPTPILLAYIIMQSKLQPDPDYKEMFAAISALFFSIFHLIRSIWGIIKLISFRRWAIKITKSFESASYPYEDDPTSLPLSTTSNSNSNSSQKDRPNLISRFKPISNNFMHRSYSSRTSNTTASIPSYFHDSRESSFEDDSGLSLLTSQNTSSTNRVYCSSLIHDRFKTFFRYVKDFFSSLFSVFRKKDDDGERIFERVNDILVNNNIVDNEIIGSSAPGVNIFRCSITPNDPLKNFVYWTVPYLAQLGRLWLREAKFHQFPTQEWNDQRQELATEVWGAAVFGMEKDFEGKRGNIDSESILDPDDWNNLISNGPGDVFSKNDIIQICFSKGNGMPFEKPIFDGTVDQNRMRAQISAHMKQISTSLPADLADVASRLTPQHLEWFAIFASVREWKGPPRAKKTRSQRPRRFSKNFSRSTQVSKLKTKKEQISFSKTITENDVPVLLIQDQLGLDQSPPISHCAFPFVHRTYGKLLWEQKTILQVSARIDNWIALSVGEELQLLLTKKTVLDEFNSAPNIEDQDQEEELNQFASGNVERDALNSEEKVDQTIFKRHEKLETTRLQYQLVQHAKNHHEQGLSFMGCVVETIRSKMADSLPELYDKESNTAKDWTPRIPDDMVKVEFSEQLSEQLSRFSNSGKEASQPPSISYSMKERLLWECQNGICWASQSLASDRLQRISFKSRPQESICMMMLFILGYPSITVDTMCAPQKDDDHVPVVACLRPVAAPQDIQIRVTLKKETNRVSRDEDEDEDSKDMIGILEIVMNPGDDHISRNDITFQWQAWRDAFEGRLRGKAVWQRNHFMRNLRIHHTTMPITKGIVSQAEGRYLTWKGWEPFRAGLSTFELKYCSLIIIEDELRMNSRVQRLPKSASVFPPSTNPIAFLPSAPQRGGANPTNTNQPPTVASAAQLQLPVQPETTHAGSSTEQTNARPSRPNDSELPGSSSTAQPGVTPAVHSDPLSSSNRTHHQATHSVPNHDKNSQQSVPQIQPTLAAPRNKQVTPEPSRMQIESDILMRSRASPVPSNSPLQALPKLASNNQSTRTQAQVQNAVATNLQLNNPGSSSSGEKPSSSNSISSSESQTLHVSRTRSSTYMSYDYDKATIVELTDASLHLNGLLNLDSIIEKSDNPLDPDYEPSRDDHAKIIATATRKEGTQSTDGIRGNKPQAAFSNFQIRSPGSQTTTRKLPVQLKDVVDEIFEEETWRKAQRQDHVAMYRLATWYLKGSHTHHVNKQKALLLLKRSLVIGKTVMTANLYISTLLQIAHESNNADQLNLVDRALWAVNFLWRDIEQGQNIDKLGKRKTTWKKTNETVDEKEKRMLSIIQLNRRILRTRSNAEMMLGFGTRLCKHDTTKTQVYRSEAISLFESAIIANCDETAMLRLVVLKAAEDVNYAHLLYHSALVTHKRKCYCQGTNKKDSAEFSRLRYTGSLKPEEEAKHKEFQNERGRLGELRSVDDNIRWIMNTQPGDTSPSSQHPDTNTVSFAGQNAENENDDDDRGGEASWRITPRPQHVTIDMDESATQVE